MKMACAEIRMLSRAEYERVCSLYSMKLDMKLVSSNPACNRFSWEGSLRRGPERPGYHHAVYLKLRELMAEMDEKHWDQLRARRGLVVFLKSASLELDEYLSLARDEREALELCNALTIDFEQGVEELVAILIYRWKVSVSRMEEKRKEEIKQKQVQMEEKFSSRRDGVDALAARMTLKAGERYMRQQAKDPNRINRDGRVSLGSSRRGTGSMSAGVRRRGWMDDVKAKDNNRSLLDERSNVQMKHLMDLQNEKEKDGLWWVRDLQEKRMRDQMFHQRALMEKVGGAEEPLNARLRYLPFSRDLQEKEMRINRLLNKAKP